MNMGTSALFMAVLFVAGHFASGEEDYKRCVGDFNLTNECPPYSRETSSQWMCLAKMKRCPDRFHCARDDKTKMFNMICADPVPCYAGQEPRINMAAKRVYCFYCYNKERYGNNYERQSNTLSQCEFQKSLPEHSVVYEDFNDIRRYLQNYDYRCKSEDNYILEGFQHYPNFYTNDSHGRCISADPCPLGQERILNYLCVDKCGENMARDHKFQCLQKAPTYVNDQAQSIEEMSVSPTRTTTESILKLPHGNESSIDKKYIFVIVMFILGAVLTVVVVLLTLFQQKVVTHFRKRRPIKDKTTVHLMNAFYTHLKNDLQKKDSSSMEKVKPDYSHITEEAAEDYDVNLEIKTDFLAIQNELGPRRRQDSGISRGSQTSSEERDRKIEEPEKDASVEVGNHSKQDSGISSGSGTFSETSDGKIERSEKDTSVEVGIHSKQDSGISSGSETFSEKWDGKLQVTEEDTSVEVGKHPKQDSQFTSAPNGSSIVQCPNQKEESGLTDFQKEEGGKENSSVETNDESPDEEIYTSADEGMNYEKADIPPAWNNTTENRGKGDKGSCAEPPSSDIGQQNSDYKSLPSLARRNSTEKRRNSNKSSGAEPPSSDIEQQNSENKGLPPLARRNSTEKRRNRDKSSGAEPPSSDVGQQNSENKDLPPFACFEGHKEDNIIIDQKPLSDIEEQNSENIFLPPPAGFDGHNKGDQNVVDEEPNSSDVQKQKLGNNDLPPPAGIKGHFEEDKKFVGEQNSREYDFNPNSEYKEQKKTKADRRDTGDERENEEQDTAEQPGPVETVGVCSTNEIGTSVDVKNISEKLRSERTGEKSDTSEQNEPGKTDNLRFKVTETSADLENTTEGVGLAMNQLSQLAGLQALKTMLDPHGARPPISSALVQHMIGPHSAPSVQYLSHNPGTPFNPRTMNTPLANMKNGPVSPHSCVNGC